MNLVESHQKASRLMQRIDEKMEGLKLGGDINSRVSGGLLHLSLEHFGAIFVLVSNDLNGSAAALFRLQYEALIRGLYFHQCASDEQAEAFVKGKEPPKVKDMIGCLESKPALSTGGLSRIHQNMWKTMNGYTHGGLEQLQRRYSGSDLSACFSEQEREELLRSSTSLALVAATYVASVSGSTELAAELINEFGKGQR